MNLHKFIPGLLLFGFSFTAVARNAADTIRKETTDIYPRKGKFTFYWGYNRSAYSHSNMNFKGNGYNFSINDIRATDDPTPLTSEYVQPNELTVPQFNIRVGYYLDDKSFISFGYDHMKYSMVTQTTHLTGTISEGNDAGVYKNTEVVVGENADVGNHGPSIIDNLPKGFVSNFEHCDGLNDFAFEYGRLSQLWISKNHKHALSVVGTLAVGAVIPDTDADVLGQPPKHNMDKNKKAYHLAGYSFSASMGLQLDLFRHLFILAKLKGGYMNLPDINTTAYGGKASQHFTFIEPIGVIGYTFRL